jgi:hypothetical protein
MGRDKKNPKPLDATAFATLVKTASEVLARHEQHQHAMLHKSLDITVGAARITVTLDIEPDEDDPSATLTARDEFDEVVCSKRVVCQNDHLNVGQLCNRYEVAVWVVGQRLEEEAVTNDRPVGGHQQRVTVGRGAGNLLGAEDGAGASNILHNDVVAPQSLERLCQLAGDDVGTAAWSQRHDQGHGLLGKRDLRTCRRTLGGKSKQDGQDAEQTVHV